MNRLTKFLPVLIAAAALATPAASLAGTSTGTLSVTASVSQNCLINSPTLAFGSYDPIVTNATTALTASATATFTCTEGASAVYVTANTGGNTGHATGTTRAMAGGSGYLSYELYTDSGHTLVWNTTNSGGHTYTPSFASSQTANATVYGSIPAGQNVPVASYSDSVTMTINF